MLFTDQLLDLLQHILATHRIIHTLPFLTINNANNKRVFL